MIARGIHRSWRAVVWAVAACLGLGVIATATRADDPPKSPLEQADRMEHEGRELMEKGHKPEGARLIAKAWHIRAEVFTHEEREAAAGSAPAPAELERIKARVAELEAQSAAHEKEGHKAKDE